MKNTIRKIVIANRGEIVNRIRRSAAAMGIDTVVLYSYADRHAQWVTSADEAFSLGDGNLADTYLNIGRIIDLSLQCGADAIHPGYGFLSENFLFAQACLENDIIFIGPSPAILKRMGDKIAAHEFVRDLGIAVPERITGFPDVGSVHQAGITFPVLVKAVAGGGGKGMRFVKEAEELNSTLTTTASEALQYFGDDRIYMEQYLPSVRHVEVQILGDQHGSIVHLFDRECSVQRRHQKIIEEAPAAFLEEDIRNGMVQASLKIAAALKYTGAGTMEFLLDDQGKYYFLEMNPRIQVEHGITEMITGIDMVKEQIIIASGQPLTFRNGEIVPRGHAIEARIYAEDPENDLLPFPGQIQFYKEPDIPGTRIESAFGSGSMIPPEYDPLIAKVIVHASSRNEAMNKIRTVLQDFVITGVRHNIPLLQEIFRDEEFSNHEISTRYLEQHLPVFCDHINIRRMKADKPLLAIAAAVYVLRPGTQPGLGSPWQSGFWRNTSQIRFAIGTDIFELHYIRTSAHSMEFFLNNKPYRIHGIETGNGQLNFLLHDIPLHFYPFQHPDGSLEISDGSLSYRIDRWINHHEAFHAGRGESRESGETIVSPLPGKIFRIHVSTGVRVNRGDVLVTIESMKLENNMLAVHPGIIKEILIHEGDQVRKDQILLHINQLITH